MGAKLPVISGRDAVRVFGKLGWSVARQASSHVIMIKPGEIVTLSVPLHDPVAKGTLRKLIRLANVTIDDFVAAL